MSAIAQAPRRLDLRPADDERPLGSYTLLMGVFASLAAVFGLWFKRSGRQLPDRIDAADLALITVAAHKSARLLSKDRITSPLRAPFTSPEGDASAPGEVAESSRGQGLRKAVGELLLCPYCLGMWTAGGFVAGLLTLPRFTRWAAAVLDVFFGSELLQIAYKRAEETLQ